jgi:hypothetical protein
MSKTTLILFALCSLGGVASLITWILTDDNDWIILWAILTSAYFDIRISRIIELIKNKTP